MQLTSQTKNKDKSQTLLQEKEIEITVEKATN